MVTQPTRPLRPAPPYLVLQHLLPLRIHFLLSLLIQRLHPPATGERSAEKRREDQTHAPSHLEGRIAVNLIYVQYMTLFRCSLSCSWAACDLGPVRWLILLTCHRAPSPNHPMTSQQRSTSLCPLLTHLVSVDSFDSAAPVVPGGCRFGFPVVICTSLARQPTCFSRGQ